MDPSGWRTAASAESTCHFGMSRHPMCPLSFFHHLLCPVICLRHLHRLNPVTQHVSVSTTTSVPSEACSTTRRPVQFKLSTAEKTAARRDPPRTKRGSIRRQPLSSDEEEALAEMSYAPGVNVTRRPRTRRVTRAPWLGRFPPELRRILCYRGLRQHLTAS